MIAQTGAANVLREAFGGQRVYAVLDGARSRRVRGWVFDTRAPRACLYRGKLPAVLEDAAPWLLHMQPGAPYTDDFFARFWNESWGILLSCAAQPEEVRRHLRHFLLARTEDGDKLLFRFYDPRVLRLYLPTCTGEELAAFFGPISAFAVPEGGGDGALIFRLAEGRLVEERAGQVAGSYQDALS